MLRHFLLSIALLTNAWLGIAPAHPASTTYAVAQKVSVNTGGFDPHYRLSLAHPVQDKNFYLLSLFQRNAAIRKLLMTNASLRQLSEEKRFALQKAPACNDVKCFEDLFRFNARTIETVATALEVLANQPEFKRLAKKHLRPSGVFIKYSRQSDSQMLAAAWKDAANSLNRILSVYGLGKDPLYKNIDRVSFDVSKDDYRNLLRAKAQEIKFVNEPLFFDPTLDFALKLLEINRRDEAGRYEPLDSGENRATVQNLRKIKWADYPYTFILVLGSGPGDSAPLSPIGAKRADVAAQLFLQHKAPLIIFSGGHVHPMQTPYCEAIEMKKYVIEKYKIPATSILIEPHARHTTTNFRNGARLVFRFGIPTDRKALVTSSEDHISYCVGQEFHDRNVKELGYFPVEFITRVSPVSAEFEPSVMSLFFDSNDPLDP
jgi:hypothetical protein